MALKEIFTYESALMEILKFIFSVSLMLWMKQAGKPSDEVNDYINKIVQMSKEPIEVSIVQIWTKSNAESFSISGFVLKILVDEEDDRSLLKAFRDLVSIATEAREQQKRRVLISTWDDEEDW